MANAAALSAVRRCGLSSWCELGDRHELEPALTRRLEDVRHRRDGLRPVAALAGAVAVVQEQDRAGPQHALAAGHDRVDARAGGVEDGAGPAHHPVALLPGHRRDERVSEAVWRPEELGRPCRRPRRRAALSAARNWCTIARGPGEHEQRVVLAVARQLVALGDDPAGDVGMRAHLAPECEERGPRARIPERVEHPGRPLRARAVVEGDRHHRLGRRAEADHPSEEACVRCERRPRDRDQDEDGGCDDDLAGPAADLLPDHRRRRQPDGGCDHEANDDVALAHTGLTPASRSS